MPKKLSAIRQKILRYIISYMEENAGRAPTNREIGDYVNSRSTGHIDYHLKFLEAEKYITHESNISRSIKVLKDCEGVPFIEKEKARYLLPVKGPVAAGQQLAIPNEPVEMFDLSMQNFAEGAFGLKVKGLSMVEFGIFDGDYIIIEQGKQPETGDIVIAVNLTENAATVKYFYKLEDDRVKLQPANEAIEPIYIKAEEWDNHWAIQGVVRAVFRKYDRVHAKAARSAKQSAAASALEQA